MQIIVENSRKYKCKQLWKIHEDTNAKNCRKFKRIQMHIIVENSRGYKCKQFWKTQEDCRS